MYNLLITFLLAISLQGCGGAEAQSAPTNGASDALSKAVTYIRDTTTAIGGSLSWVNTGHYIKTITGKAETALEWTSLTVLDNHSDVSAGNTAAYFQANKFSTGATFAAVSEASDTTGLIGALVAHEFDSWVTGPDTGSRIGLEVVNGDALAIRGVGKSSVAESTAAIRIGQTMSTPYAAWTDGIVLMGNYKNSAIKLVAPNGVVVFEIKPNGDIYRRGVLLP